LEPKFLNTRNQIKRNAKGSSITINFHPRRGEETYVKAKKKKEKKKKIKKEFKLKKFFTHAKEKKPIKKKKKKKKKKKSSKFSQTCFAAHQHVQMNSSR